MQVQAIDQPRYRSILPSHGARDCHAVALIKSARDLVFPPHAQVQIAASGLHDFIHEFPKNSPARAAELVAVENLMKHDRASGHIDVAHASAFPVLLVCDNNTVLVDALVPLDAALQRVPPNVREHVPVGLKMPVDRLEIAQTRVAHGLLLLEHEDRFGFEDALPDMFQSAHFAQLKVQGLDPTPAVFFGEFEEDLR